MSTQDLFVDAQGQPLRFIVPRYRRRQEIREAIESHGGEVAETHARHNVYMSLMDPEEQSEADNVPANTYSSKYIFDCISSGYLMDKRNYLFNDGFAAGKKRTRTAFSTEDDQLLIRRLADNGPNTALMGTKVYRELARDYPHHTEQSWRSRYIKEIQPKGLVEKYRDIGERLFDKNHQSDAARVEVTPSPTQRPRTLAEGRSIPQSVRAAEVQNARQREGVTSSRKRPAKSDENLDAGSSKRRVPHTENVTLTKKVLGSAGLASNGRNSVNVKSAREQKEVDADYEDREPLFSDTDENLKENRPVVTEKSAEPKSAFSLMERRLMTETSSSREEVLLALKMASLVEKNARAVLECNFNLPELDPGLRKWIFSAPEDAILTSDDETKKARIMSFAPRRSANKESAVTKQLSSGVSKGRRKRREDPHTPCLHLERVLGLSTSNAFGIDIHPNPDTPLVAFPAGGIVTIYNHRKNRQTAFLIPSSATLNVSSLANDSQSDDSNSNSQSTSGRRTPVGNAMKSVSCVAFSPDGGYLAAGESGHQPRIVIWDYANNTIISELRGHKFGIAAITFSPNQNTTDSYTFGTGGLARGLLILESAQRITFDDTGSFFVTAGFRHFKFWYLEANGTIPKPAKPPQRGQAQVLEGKFGITSEILTYAITEKGILVLFSEDRVMEKWVDLKVARGRCIAVTDKMIVCGCSDGVIRLFEPITLKYIATIPKPHPLGVDVASSVGSSYKVNANPDSAFPDAICVKVDSTGEKIVCVYNDQSLFIWDVKDWKHIGKYRSFLYHSDCIWGVEVAPSHLSIDDVGASYDSLSPSASDTPHTPLPPPRGLPPNSFVTFSSDCTIRFWNIDGTQQQAKDGDAVSSNGIGSYFRRNIYSRELLKMLYVDNLKLKSSTEANREEDKGEGADNSHQRGIRSLKISRDGKLMASGDRMGNLLTVIRIYELETFTMLKYLEVHDAEVLTLDFSSELDGPRYLATGGRDRLIHIFDVKRGFNLNQTMDDHSSSITAVRFSHYGRKLMSSAADKSVIFRNLNGFGDNIEFSTYHNAIGRATVFDIDVTPSYEYLATVSQDRRLNIFSIESGKPIRSYRPDPTEDPGLESGSGGLIKVAVDPSGCFIATCGSDKCIRIFDFASGACIARALGHADLITGIKFTHDCSRLISTSADGCILIWKIANEVSKFMQDRIQKPSDSSGMMDEEMDMLSEMGSRQLETPLGYYSETSERESNDSSAIFRPPPTGGFVFGFNESMLPSWARSGKDSDPVGTRTTNGLPLPTKGRWASRVDNNGISLFSEALEADRPVAKFDDLFTRRFSIEQSPLPHLAEKGPEKFADEGNVDGDIVVEDLEPGAESGFVDQSLEGAGADVYEVDFESDHDVEDAEATIFVDNSCAPDACDDPSSFVITEEKVEEQKTSPVKAENEDETLKGAEGEESGKDKRKIDTSSQDESTEPEDNESHLGKLTLEEYLLQPVDTSSVRQSISTQHLIRRRTVVPAEEISVELQELLESAEGKELHLPSESVSLELDADPSTVLGAVSTKESYSLHKPSGFQTASITADTLEKEREFVEPVDENQSIDEEIIPEYETIDMDGLSTTVDKNLTQIKDCLNNLKAQMAILESTKMSLKTDSNEARLLQHIRSSLYEATDMAQNILGQPKPDIDMTAVLEKYSDILVGLVEKKLQGSTPS
ncbi:hypothetical protein HDU97_003573 [Phlyctochytrium planicorne]|nr:hypothetical protein HDU97_003573 [Phlyctochytrium planicorne]